jgi:hypothetical protein
MLYVCQVGNQETHRVEIDQPFIGRVLTVRVDDKAVVTHKSRPFQFEYTIPFSVGVDEAHNIELRINYLMAKYEVYVDGKLFVANMFPQAIGYNAFLLALMAFTMSLLACVILANAVLLLIKSGV